MMQRLILVCLALLLQQRKDVCEGRLQVVRVALSEAKNDRTTSNDSFFNNDEELENEESIYSIEEERRELFTRTLQTGMSMTGGGMGSPDGMGNGMGGGGSGMIGGGMGSPDGMGNGMGGGGGGGGMNGGGMGSPDGMGNGMGGGSGGKIGRASCRERV